MLSLSSRLHSHPAHPCSLIPLSSRIARNSCTHLHQSQMFTRSQISRSHLSHLSPSHPSHLSCLSTSHPSLPLFLPSHLFMSRALILLSLFSLSHSRLAHALLFRSLISRALLFRSLRANFRRNLLSTGGTQIHYDDPRSAKLGLAPLPVSESCIRVTRMPGASW